MEAEFPRDSSKCPYCGAPQRDSQAIRRHVGQSKRCRDIQLAVLNAAQVHGGPGHRGGGDGPDEHEADNVQDDDIVMQELEVDVPMDLDLDAERVMAEIDVQVPQEQRREPPLPNTIFDFDPHRIYVRSHPTAGAPIDDVKKPMNFEKLANKIVLDDDKGKFGPFKSEMEWKFCEWAVKNLGQGQINDLLGLDFVSEIITHRLHTNPYRYSPSDQRRGTLLPQRAQAFSAC